MLSPSFDILNKPDNEDLYANLFNAFNPLFLWQEILDSDISSKDKRFNSNLWQQNSAYKYIANCYVMACNMAIASLNNLDLAEQDKAKSEFFLNQYLEAFAPTNFIFSNPNAIKSIIDSEGQSIVDGMVNYLQDIQKGYITQSKPESFTIGRNIAITAGHIIKKTELYELINYSNDDSVEHGVKVKFANPILIVPPTINKYYILDLQQHNSLVKFLVDSGFDVYLISWRNPQIHEEINFSWGEYTQAVQDNLDYINQTSNNNVHVMGFCIGGTIASCALALDQQNNSKLASLSLLTTLLDFNNAGILSQLIDSAQFACTKQSMLNDKILLGKDLAFLFNTLKPQDLIWKYVSESYLQGKTPPPFDILYWNNDNTNLSYDMYCWYIENTYLSNNLINKRAEVNEKIINLNNISAPIYAVGCEEDHIVPWHKALSSFTYVVDETKRQYSQFILSSSGHVGGIINPLTPSIKSKRYYYQIQPNNQNLELAIDLGQYHKNNGSWWGNWQQWLAQHSIELQSSLPKYQHEILYNAPGIYVMT